MISLGTQIPLKYDLGFEYKFLPKFSSNLNFGILTKPYDAAILGIIQAFGLEEGYINMIGNAFKLGLVTDLGFRFHHKKIILEFLVSTFICWLKTLQMN